MKKVKLATPLSAGILMLGAVTLTAHSGNYYSDNNMIITVIMFVNLSNRHKVLTLLCHKL